VVNYNNGNEIGKEIIEKAAMTKVFKGKLTPMGFTGYNRSRIPWLDFASTFAVARR